MGVEQSIQRRLLTHSVVNKSFAEHLPVVGCKTACPTSGVNRMDLDVHSQ